MKKENALISTPKHSQALHPAKQLEQLAPATYRDVFACPTPALSVVRKNGGEVMAAAYVMAMLQDIENFYGVDFSGGDQLRAIAQMILKQYYYLKVSDLKLFADNFKAGKYGKVYNRLDGGTIMEALAQYADERMSEAETSSEQAASQFKTRSNSAAMKITEAIVNHWRDVLHEKKPKPVFRSIGQYCRFYGLDEEKIIDAIGDQIDSDYRAAGIDMEIGDYRKAWLNQWLWDKTNEARKK